MYGYVRVISFHWVCLVMVIAFVGSPIFSTLNRFQTDRVSRVQYSHFPD